METNSVAIIGAISALLAAVLGIVFKMWKDHTDLTKQVISVVERNAVANERLLGSVDKNTSATKESVEATKQTRDSMSQIMLELIKRT